MKRAPAQAEIAWPLTDEQQCRADTETRRKVAVKSAAAKAYLDDRDQERNGPMSDGTPYTPWQRTVIAEWHRRNPAPLISAYTHKRYVPWGVYCLDCKTPAVMIPADKHHPNGYCICPQCSVRPLAVLVEGNAE